MAKMRRAVIDHDDGLPCYQIFGEDSRDIGDETVGAIECRHFVRAVNLSKQGNKLVF